MHMTREQYDQVPRQDARPLRIFLLALGLVVLGIALGIAFG